MLHHKNFVLVSRSGEKKVNQKHKENLVEVQGGTQKWELLHAKAKVHMGASGLQQVGYVF